MYLIFDTSGNGKPKSFKASYDDPFNWPRLLHVSWIVLGEDLKPLKDFNCLIKPEGFTPSPEPLRTHHLEAERLQERGNSLKDVLDEFAKSVQEAEYVFAHNLALNEGIIGAEYYRKTMSNPLTSADKYCLMHEATYYCKLPGKKGYKWPTLKEMHSIIFNQIYSPLQNARADVIAASRCFIALKKGGALDDLFFD